MFVGQGETFNRNLYTDWDIGQPPLPVIEGVDYVPKFRQVKRPGQPPATMPLRMLNNNLNNNVQSVRTHPYASRSQPRTPVQTSMEYTPAPVQLQPPVEYTPVEYTPTPLQPPIEYTPTPVQPSDTSSQTVSPSKIAKVMKVLMLPMSVVQTMFSGAFTSTSVQSLHSSQPAAATVPSFQDDARLPTPTIPPSPPFDSATSPGITLEPPISSNTNIPVTTPLPLPGIFLNTPPVTMQDDDNLYDKLIAPGHLWSYPANLRKWK